MTTVRDERLPTFLVIGASKTGTTSLHHYLSQHPDIYMSPEKEPGFFLFEGKPAVDRRLRDRPFVNSLTDYQCLFNGAQHSQRRGECSTFHTKSPASICLSACMAAKIGAKVVGHGRYVTFQLVEVAVPRELFRKMLCLIDGLRPRPAPA